MTTLASGFGATNLSPGYDIASPHANAAVAASIWAKIGVLFVVGMPSGAMGAVQSCLARALHHSSAKHVFSLRHRLQVFGIHASRISTQMIQNQPVWDWTHVHLEREAVGQNFNMAAVKPPIPQFVPGSLPLPASIRGDDVTRLESLNHSIREYVEIFSKRGWNHDAGPSLGERRAWSGRGGISIARCSLCASTRSARRIAADSESNPYRSRMIAMDCSSIVSNQNVFRFIPTV